MGDCTCVLCGKGIEETLFHLFLGCSFSQNCWNYICPTGLQNLSIHEAIMDFKDRLQQPFCMEIIILASWSIWITRNKKDPTFEEWKRTFKKEFALVTRTAPRIGTPCTPPCRPVRRGSAPTCLQMELTSA